ncbi:flagellar biosynthesis anti-sigma factor FlgM [Xylophilus sp.]|uniref:flagellar biosynthesis anti-sigma factor FlgM n=1 Tax=Xylophilus sp. TaxID=2653893 RepID=UPI0013BADC55|nr:flagellar biosynthesis anti-sigma factor FlgM [Xylophilus sp.]KAF1044608.1 MAG: hypothetical protein GAK38_03443 [Xylophilus sp.]
MKIGQATPDLPGASGAAQSQKSVRNNTASSSDAAAAPAAPARDAASSTSGVPVTVSTLARSLDAADKASNGEFNAARVDAVKKAIDRGEFTVDAEAVADKLLSNAQEQLVRSRSTPQSSS